jgi:CO/xanthine dehydrogenase FAD-binding subunit
MKRVANRAAYVAPESIDTAADIFKSEENAVYLAGGTDLVPQFKYGLNRTDCLIDLQKIDELKQITETEAGILIGSMSTLADVTQSDLIERKLSPVARAAFSVASPQIRNMATIGGNILQQRRCLYLNQSEYWRESVPPCFKRGGSLCYQVPRAKICRAVYYSDLATVLLAYDAGVRVYDGKNRQILPLESVIRSHTRDEKIRYLITGFVIPAANVGAIGKFLKYRTRGAIDFALSNVGICFSPGNGADREPRGSIYAGAVSPAPLRLRRTENVLLKSVMEPEPIPDSVRYEIIRTGKEELESLSAPIRETTVSMKAKRKSLLIIVEALRDFLQHFE